MYHVRSNGRIIKEASSSNASVHIPSCIRLGGDTAVKVLTVTAPHLFASYLLKEMMTFSE